MWLLAAAAAWSWELGEPPDPAIRPYPWPADGELRWCVDARAPGLAAPAAAAVDAWMAAAPCTGLRAVALATCDDPGEPPNLVFGAEAHDEGVLVVSWIRQGGVATISLNDTVDFADDDDVIGGTCADRPVRSSVLVGALGRLFGLVDPCADGDCTADEAASAAHRAFDPCVVATPTADDALGLMDVFAPPPTITCAPAAGPIPLAALCEVDPGPARVDWGDGTVGDAIAHTYATPGTFDVAVQVARADLCAAGQATFPGLVHACEPNDARLVAAVDGHDVALSLAQPPGDATCHTGVAWTVTDAAGAVVATGDRLSWTVTLDAGTYTITAALDGLAGASMDRQTVVVGGRGCDAGGGRGGWALLGLLAARRRLSPSPTRA